MSRPLFPNSVAYRPDGEPWAYAPFALELLTTPAVRTASAYPTRPIYKFSTDANGAFATDLTISTPETGAWLWRLWWPDRRYIDAYIEQGDGAAIEIDDWVTLAGLSSSSAGTPQGEMLNGLYTAVSGAADGKMLETLGGDLTLVDAPEGMPEPSSDGLWARFVASAVGSWLQATTVGAALFAAVDAAAGRAALGAAASAGSGTAGELMVSDATGNSVRAGYTASQSASANTVARRTSDGGVAAIGNNAAGVDGRSIHHVGVYGESAATSGSGVSGYSPTTGTGVTGVSASGSGGQSTSMGGTYHHRFGTKSAIDRLSGILKFVDSTAASDRAAQRTELGLGSAAILDASTGPTASSVVQRQSTGQLKNDISSADNTDAIRGSSVAGRGVYGTSNTVAGVEGYSASGSGVVASSQAGMYALEAKSGATQVSGIRRADGVLEFVGVNAVANRAAQRAELGLGTMATATAADYVLKDAAILSKAAGYQLTTGDEAKIIECNGTFTITLPNGLDTGFQCTIVNVGTGTITLAAATTLQSKDSAVTLPNQYSAATVYHRGSNVWLAFGDLI